MEWAPAVSVVVVRVAAPAVTVTGAPRLVAPSLNWTVPVVVPVPGAVMATVAVKETDWPTVDGLGPAVRVTVVDVAAWLTVWATAVEVMLVKLTSPESMAVI